MLNTDKAFNAIQFNKFDAAYIKVKTAEEYAIIAAEPYLAVFEQSVNQAEIECCLGLTRGAVRYCGCFSYAACPKRKYRTGGVLKLIERTIEPNKKGARRLEEQHQMACRDWADSHTPSSPDRYSVERLILQTAAAYLRWKALCILFAQYNPATSS